MEADLKTLDSGSLKPSLEALLLVASDSVPATELAKITGAAPGEVASALAELSVEYTEANRGFQLREVAGGWRLLGYAPAFSGCLGDSCRYCISSTGLTRRRPRDSRR